LRAREGEAIHAIGYHSVPVSEGNCHCAGLLRRFPPRNDGCRMDGLAGRLVPPVIARHAPLSLRARKGEAIHAIGYYSVPVSEDYRRFAGLLRRFPPRHDGKGGTTPAMTRDAMPSR
jgi:hypothetical protein